jgi:hypothetical protein
VSLLRFGTTHLAGWPLPLLVASPSSPPPPPSESPSSPGPRLSLPRLGLPPAASPRPVTGGVVLWIAPLRCFPFSSFCSSSSSLHPKIANGRLLLLAKCRFRASLFIGAMIYKIYSDKAFSGICSQKLRAARARAALRFRQSLAKIGPVVTELRRF